jgi:RNA polymerase sporulation-specific sigma factor
MKLYAAMTDEQLQALAVERQSGAEEALAERYVRLVRACARPYFLAGGDSEDLIQEGMLGLLSAIREYDSSRGVRFKTYAEVCINHRIQAAIRSALRKKHAPLNDGVPLDEVLSDESQSLGTQHFQRSPEEQVLARESEREFISAYSRCLSKLETQILSLYLDGLSYQEMAAATGRNVKSVDNAVQRIRKKLVNLPSGENSGS